MPRGDGTGPRGEGPLTGRGLGPCNPDTSRAGSDAPGYGAGYGPGNGAGYGAGRGAGRRWWRRRPRRPIVK